jgi:transposase
LKERKKYTKEFKLDTVSLIIEKNYTQAEASKSLVINANVLGR